MFKKISYLLLCLPIMLKATDIDMINYNNFLADEAERKVLEMKNRAKEWFDELGGGTKNPRKILSIVSEEERKFEVLEGEHNSERTEITFDNALQIFRNRVFGGIYMNIQKELLAKEKKQAEELINRIEQYTKLALIANKLQIDQISHRYKASGDGKRQKLDDSEISRTNDHNDLNSIQDIAEENLNSEEILAVSKKISCSENQIPDTHKSIIKINPSFFVSSLIPFLSEGSYSDFKNRLSKVAPGLATEFN